MKEPKDRLKEAREAAGFSSASQAAAHFGWKSSTYRAHENGQNQFSYSDARKYGKAFNVSSIWLVSEIDTVKDFEERNMGTVSTSTGPNEKTPLIPPFIEAPLRNDMPANLPVYGFAVGGKEDNGEFYMNGQIANYVRRPPGIMNMRGIFGVYVCGESMVPRFKPGELVFAGGAQTPAIGDDVVVELKALNSEFDDEADQAARGLIKCLKRRTATKIVVEQYNPPMEIEFDKNAIKAIHRVLTSNDLYGT